MTLDIQIAPATDRHRQHDLAVNRQLIAGRREFLGYLRRRLGSLEEAEDVLQSFSLKVIRASGSASGEEKINAWMGRILRNTLVDHYRRRAVRQRAEAAFVVEQELAAPYAEADPGNARSHCLAVALQRVRPDDADVIRRAELDGEPRGHIAADLGLTTNALNVRLHRARQALRREMESSCPPGRVGKCLDCSLEGLATSRLSIPFRQVPEPHPSRPASEE